MIGRTLDHYRIESKLGEGGMGVVYRAQDVHLDRAVAIKVLPPDKVADAERKQRFMQEARAASALNHPHIVTIYDIRSEAGIDFIVMELIEGKTLDECIAPKGMRAGQALKYAVQIADALAKAHGAGIIHRDLKPSNIMVTADGRIKVLDFGLAKLMEPADTSPDAPTLTMRELTEQGAVVGTAPYMSPEQAEGRTLDVRSDIFSFGSVLYKMTTGRGPFAGDSRIAILSKVLNQDPTPPSQVAAAIPPEFEKIVLRCLRKDPARRFQTMADLKVALEDLREETEAGRPVRLPSSRKRWIWAAVIVLLPLAGFFARQAWRATESAEPLRAVPLMTQPGVQSYPSFSPEGTHVAFTWTGPKQDNPDIYVQQIGAGTPLRLTTDPGQDYNPAWSPDGKWIAFLRGESARSEVRLIAPLGGTERKVAEIRVRESFVTPPYLSWCADSNCLVVTDSPGEGQADALFAISVEGGDRKQLTHPKSPAIGDTNPAVSPDGGWLVFRRSSGMYGNAIYRVALAKSAAGVSTAGEPLRLTEGTLDPNYPTWTPDGKEILFSGLRSLWRIAVSRNSAPARLPFVGEDGTMPVVSRPQPGRPSRLVYVHSFADDNIWRVDTTAPGVAAATPPVVCISSTRREGMPQLSPDGRRVAFFSDRSGESDIWVASIDGSSAVKLTSMHGAPATGYPHWSPDGETIVFHSHRDVYIVPAAGGKARNLTNHPAGDSFPSYSRDGKWIYFCSNRASRDRKIWKLPAAGGDAVPVSDFPALVPQESPDGKYLYYVQSMFTPGALWRVPVAGGKPDKVLDGVVMGDYVVLKGGIYYLDRPSGESGMYLIDRPIGETRLRYFDFATRKSTTVAGNLGKVDVPITATQDGRTILFPREDAAVNDLMLVENFR